MIRREKMSNERGITMIALSLAIVILSILAGVSLNLGFAENSSILEQVENETAIQEEMIKEEQRKTNSVIKKFEDDWGI